MSIQDDIEALRQIASSDKLPFGELNRLQSELLDVNAEVMRILGPGSGFAHGIGGCAAAVSDAISTAVARLGEFESAIHDAADRLAEGG